MNSPIKGKTYPAFITDLLAREKSLADDPEVKQLDVTKQVSQCLDTYDKLKKAAEKQVTMWKFANTKHQDWLTTIDDMISKKDNFVEALEDVKQTADIIKDIRLGIKKQANQRRRADNYRTAKFWKALMQGGIAETIAKGMAEPAVAVIDQQERKMGARSWTADGDNAEPCRCAASCEFEIHVVTKEFVEKNKEGLLAEAVRLLPQMTAGGSIMKRLDNGRGETTLSKVELFKDLADDLNRPWLLLAQAYSNILGPMRWPFPGLPCLLYSMDSMMSVCYVQVDVLLKNHLSLDSPSWVGTAQSLSETDLTFEVLDAGESLWLPAGYVATWAHLPGRGQVDKADKSAIGKIIVQWVLAKECKAPQPVVTELRHSVGKVLSANENQRPFSVLKEPLQKWLADALAT